MTRGDELLAAFDELSELCGAGDRAILVDALARSGWADRPITAPLLPSGVRHGVPWALSISMTGDELDLRVWLEAQCDPPSPAGYLAAAKRMLPTFEIDAERWWHQLSFGAGTRVHAYACIPDRPHLAPKPERGFVTMVSRDHDGTRQKIYTLVPGSRAAELGDPRLASVVHPSDAPIGWLVSDGDERTLHFAAHVHGDRQLPDRLAEALGPRYARIAQGRRIHFVAWSPTKTNVYFLPEVA
ncbi:MAG TPA: hypothetical protein VGC41_16715 [Kofleriaceae bacterium]